MEAVLVASVFAEPLNHENTFSCVDMLAVSQTWKVQRGTLAVAVVAFRMELIDAPVLALFEGLKIRDAKLTALPSQCHGEQIRRVVPHKPWLGRTACHLHHC